MFLIPHLGTIIWLIIIFSVVLYLLTKFAWKPLLKALDERQTSVESALKSAKEARLSLDKIKEEQQKVIDKTKAEKEVLIKEAYMQRDKIIADANLKAQLNFKTLVENATKNIEQEKKAAIDEIKDQIAVISVDIATRLIKGDLEDKIRHERLVKDLIKDVNIN